MEKETKPIRIAIMGAGTVGGGVYKLLQMRKNDMHYIPDAVHAPEYGVCEEGIC